jgi:hypothetical protein
MLDSLFMEISDMLKCRIVAGRDWIFHLQKTKPKYPGLIWVKKINFPVAISEHESYYGKI